MVRSPVPTSFVVLLTVCLVLSATGASGATGSYDSRPAVVTGAGVHDEDHGGLELRTSASIDAAVNNTTQHEDPEEVGTRDDVGDVTRWLERQLGEDLERSSIELSQGEADLAERLLGEAFADQFERYAYVAGRTGTNEDDRAAERFRETRETQEEFAETVREFRETREEYEEARRNGNERRARERARELQRLARTANRTGSALRESYGALSNRTAADLTGASLTVRDITRNVSRQRAEVVRETFVRTTLTLRPATRRISFLEPLQLTGRLVGEDGSAPADRPVRLRIGDRTIRTRTDAEGAFSVAYRPTLLRAGERSVAVRFVPRNESIYLGTNGSVSVSVAQVVPELSVDRSPDTVAFRDRIDATGRVSAEGIGAEGVPVVVRLGGVTLGTTRTEADGTYAFTGSVPASVDDGDRELAVTVPLEGRALAGVDRSRPVAVDPTETRLAVSGDQVATGTVRVSGSLETAGATGIPDQSVELVVDGRSVATVRTNSDGGFTERIAVPSDIVPEEGNVSVTLAARYERPDSNLLESRARTTLRLQSLVGDGGGDGAGAGSGGDRILGLPDVVPVPLAAAVVVGGLLALVGGAVYLRRDGVTGGTGTDDDGSTEPSEDATTVAPPDASSGTESPMLAGAGAALDDGDPDTAVKLAFTALKQHTTERLGLPDGTHWEFYAACREAGLDDDRIDTLRRLTETYEQAAFAPRNVPEADASWVVDAASAFDRPIDTDR